jgi:hypothetical protein
MERDFDSFDGVTSKILSNGDTLEVVRASGDGLRPQWELVRVHHGGCADPSTTFRTKREALRAFAAMT